jgi:hypothetical protein
MRRAVSTAYLSERDGILDVCWNDVPREVVICPMPIRLKLSKGLLHIDERGLAVWRNIF